MALFFACNHNVFTWVVSYIISNSKSKGTNYDILTSYFKASHAKGLGYMQRG